MYTRCIHADCAMCQIKTKKKKIKTIKFHYTFFPLLIKLLFLAVMTFIISILNDFFFFLFFTFSSNLPPGLPVYLPLPLSPLLLSFSLSQKALIKTG